MVKSKIVLFVCLFVVSAVSQAYSAPSVKKLGGINSVSGIGNITSVKNDNFSNSARAASVRSVKTLNAVKPIVANKTNNSVNVSDNVNPARLSVGKYLHSAGTTSGLIKPVTTPGTTINNAEFEQIGVQVNALITRLEALENNSNINVVENDEHVGANKMVSGIDVDTDGKTLRVSRSNVKIPVGSESANPTASIWVEE